MSKSIYLTVDVECHDISKINQYIYGDKNNKSFGLKSILDTAKDLDIPVNFMLDICEEKRYGEDYIKKIVDLIHSYNQPIYFHLHPNYISGEDDKTFLWEYNEDEIKSIFLESLNIYKKYCGNQDRIVFRAGRYGVNESFYSVLNDLNVNVLDLSYFYGNNKMCKMPYEKIQSYNLPVLIEKTILLPNTTYIGFDYFGRKNTFILNVSNTTRNEFKRIVKHTSLNNIVYTMHSWDLIKKWFFNESYVSDNKHNRRKMIFCSNYARKYGFTFRNLKDFSLEEIGKDEMQNLCKGFYGKSAGLVNNFIRFADIARINKKYFFIYLSFFLVLVLLLAFLIILFVLIL